MKTLINKVQMLGYLAIAPEIITLENGKTFARITLCIIETYKDEATGKNINEHQYHQLIAWGNIARVVEKFLVKGSHVAIEGKLINRNYIDKEGIKRYVTKVEVSEILMINGQ